MCIRDSFLLGALIALFIFGFLPAIEYVGLAMKIVLGVFTAIMALLAILLAIFSMIIVSIVIEYASRFIVLEDKKAIESVRNAWYFTKKHSSESALSWLMALAARIAYSLILAVPIMIIASLTGVVSYFNWIAGWLIAFAFQLLMTIPNGYSASFDSAFWTNVYLELSDSDRIIQPDQNDDSSITATERPGLFESEITGNKVLNETTNKAASETANEITNETAGETKPVDNNPIRHYPAGNDAVDNDDHYGDRE
jgi:hypothetical protein